MAAGPPGLAEASGSNSRDQAAAVVAVAAAALTDNVRRLQSLPSTASRPFEINP